MKTRALVVVLALAAGLTPARAAPASLPLLGHVGLWLTDPQGRVVILHGVQIDHAVGSIDGIIDLTPQHVAFLSAQGFNAARVSVSFDAYEPQINQFNDAYLNQFLAFDRELARSHVYDLIDMMQGEYSPVVGGWGFPNWMTQTSGLPNTKDPFPRGYIDNPAEDAAWDNFWSNARAADGVGLQDHYARGLHRLARTFARAPGLLGIEILNEPWPGTKWPTCASPIGCPPTGFDQTQLSSFYRRMIPAVRSGDPTHLIIYEPNLLFDFGAPTELGALPDRNLLFAFHNYCLGAMPGEPQLPDPLRLCGIDENMTFANGVARANATGDATLMDEWGNTTDTALLTRMANEADQSMSGWTYWAYEDCCNSPAAIVLDGAKPPTGSNLNMTVLRAIVRPYPQAIAGTPLGWSFDPATKVFRLTYSTARVGGGVFRAGAVTRVEIPQLQYPDGYRVEVIGARVVSEPNADGLQLAALRGATTVSVTVVPA